MSKSVNEALAALLGNVEGVLNSKSVIGEPVEFGKNVIIPLVEVGFGAGAGGSDANRDNGEVESAGGGMGASIKPSAVLVVNDEGVQLVDVKNKDSVNKVIDMLPAIISKFVGNDDEKNVSDAVNNSDNN